MEDVSVSFDGFKAIDQLNFYLDAGELRCLIGPNGAGKTTMMDIITGKTTPDKGACWFGSRMNLLRMSEAEIAEAGIGRKFQKPTVFEQHTVSENLELSLPGSKTVWHIAVAKMSTIERDRLNEVLKMIGLSDVAGKLAGTLSHGQKQWLEIGMLLIQNPILLLIDEPAAGMTQREMDHTVTLLTELAGEYSILVVEHDMDFVRTLNSRITVLHQGRVLMEGAMEQVQNDTRVMEVYLGA
jgi:urea transport system ATP-binding protein